MKRSIEIARPGTIVNKKKVFEQQEKWECGIKRVSIKTKYSLVI